MLVEIGMFYTLLLNLMTLGKMSTNEALAPGVSQRVTRKVVSPQLQ